MNKTPSILIIAALLAGCSSVSESIPTVKIEKRNAKPQTQSASYMVDSGPKEAAMICESDDMRAKVIDNDDTNDAVRVMVVQDSDGGSRVLSEVEVDCRDYFLRKSLAPAKPQIVRAASPRVEKIEPTTRVKNRDSRYTYIVQSGDTVWDIAREHCTTVKDIARLNGLGRANVLDIGQRLKLPDVDCD